MRLFTAFLLASMFLAFGCKEPQNDPPVRERSYLHILGASSPGGEYNITFDFYNADDIVIEDFFYKRNFPISGYADMLAAGIPDEFGNGKLFLTTTQNNIINAVPDTLVQPTEIVLPANEESTIAFADSFGTQVMRMYSDVWDEASTDAKVRFLNLNADAPSVSINATSGAFSFTGISFLDDGSFQYVPPGTYDIQFVNDDTGGIIGTISNYSLTSWGAFTFYVTAQGGGDVDVFRH